MGRTILISKLIVDIVNPVYEDLLCFDCLNLFIQPVDEALERVLDEWDDLAA